MKRCATWAGLAVVLAFAVPLWSSCGTTEVPGSRAASKDPTSTASDQHAMPPLVLPDLSRVAESVREQIHALHSSLRAKIDDSAVPRADLARAYGEMGQLFMAADYLEAAETCYLNARTLAPDEHRWSYYLGHLYRNRDELAKALTFFQEALRLRPEDVPTLVWVGEVYLDQGRPADAEPPLLNALSLAPTSAVALFGLGRAALARQQYARAVEYLERALALDRRASILHYPLAMAYRGLGDIGKAEGHLRERGDVAVTRSDPMLRELERMLHSATSYESQGIMALNQGEAAAAASLFRRALELAPDNPAVRHRLGTALFLSGDHGAAVEQFNETLHRSPQFAKAQYSLGVIMESEGRLTEAIERFSAAVRLDPKYVEARLLLANALRRRGRLEDSLLEYERIITADPRRAEARFGYAIMLIRLKRYREARERLAEAMKVHPNQRVFAHALARLLAGVEDDGVRDGWAAMEVIQRALAQDDSLDLGITMAMTLAELGEYEEAVAWQRETIDAAQKQGRNELVPGLRESLRHYERRQPWRSPDSIELGLLPAPGAP